MINSNAWILGLLLILSVVCSAALALVNIKTEPIIRETQEASRMMTVLNVFEVSADTRDTASIRKIYNSHISEVEENGLKIFREKESGATALYLSGNGFQSVITVVVALKGDTISGFRVISQNETPGLGARIMEDRFQNQFIGKKASKGIAWTKSGKAGPGEFDAVTGATESSKALSRILNLGFTVFYNIKTEPVVPKNLDSKFMQSLLAVLGIPCDAQDQFIGKNISHGISLVKSGKAGPGESDSITGATASSSALSRILNSGFTAYSHIAALPAEEKNHAQKQVVDASIIPEAKNAAQDAIPVRMTDANPVTEAAVKGSRLPPGTERGDTTLYLSGEGFRDSITVMIALWNDTIRNFKVVNQNETPGFGDRITDEDFQHQFIGKKVSHGIELVKSGKAGMDEFAGISGATISSTALARILNSGFNQIFYTVK